jgi:biopolymer transport protein ExbD
MPRRNMSSSTLEPDMTPMIDIVFQLLTFFMVVINFENTKADERVKLPKDVLAKPPESKPKDELTLNFGFLRDSNGDKRDPVPKLFHSGGEYVVEKFKPLLEEEKRVAIARDGKDALKDMTVTIRADFEVPTGKVQELIKICQEVGYSKFSLKAIQEEVVQQE